MKNIKIIRKDNVADVIREIKKHKRGSNISLDFHVSEWGTSLYNPVGYIKTYSSSKFNKYFVSSLKKTLKNYKVQYLELTFFSHVLLRCLPAFEQLEIGRLRITVDVRLTLAQIESVLSIISGASVIEHFYYWKYSSTILPLDKLVIALSKAKVIEYFEPNFIDCWYNKKQSKLFIRQICSFKTLETIRIKSSHDWSMQLRYSNVKHIENLSFGRKTELFGIMLKFSLNVSYGLRLHDINIKMLWALIQKRRKMNIDFKTRYSHVSFKSNAYSNYPAGFLLAAMERSQITVVQSDRILDDLLLDDLRRVCRSRDERKEMRTFLT